MMLKDGAVTDASVAASEVRGGEGAEKDGEGEPEKQGSKGLRLEEEERERDEKKGD